MAEMVGKAVGKVVSPIVECVDVDGVVRRINIDDAVQRIDIDALVERIDLDHHIDRVDLNRHIQRIDIDKIIDRLDIEEIIARSNVSSIIAHSTSGIFTQLLDALRTQIVAADLFLRRVSRWKGPNEDFLPPKPTGEEIRVRYPKARSNKAVAVQGRYTGVFPKALAIILDIAFLTFSFAVFIIMFKLCWLLFQGEMSENIKKKVNRNNLWVAIVYFIYWFLYFFLGVLLTGRTLGMAIVGIKVVDSKGSDISPWQALLRTMLLPVSLTVMPFLGLIGVCRRDGRMLHGIVAGTGIVYKWDARMAKARRKAMAKLEDSPEDLSEAGEDDADADSSPTLATPLIGAETGGRGNSYSSRDRKLSSEGIEVDSKGVKSMYG